MQRAYLLFAALFGSMILQAHPSAAEAFLAVGLPSGDERRC